MASQRNELLWQLLAVVAVCCLVVMTGILVRREFFQPSPIEDLQAAARPQAPAPVDDWQRVSKSGHRIGPADAPIVIVVFSDFQCPYCARFASETFPALQSEFPGQVSMLFRHWPLRNHPMAYPAARAAECAAAQGRFEEFHNLLFAQRDSIGNKSFLRFANEVGIRDAAAFEKCATDARPVPAIDADVAEVKRIGGTGTPTLVMNGLLIRPPYSTPALALQVQSALGRSRD